MKLGENFNFSPAGSSQHEWGHEIESAAGRSSNDNNDDDNDVDTL